MLTDERPELGCRVVRKLRSRSQQVGRARVCPHVSIPDYTCGYKYTHPRSGHAAAALEQTSQELEAISRNNHTGPLTFIC